MYIHIGDILTFRQWEDMESEFGVNSNGDIMTSPFLFTHSMKQFCGTTICVKEISSEGVITAFKVYEDERVNPFDEYYFRWQLYPDMFEDALSYDPISTEELKSFLNS